MVSRGSIVWTRGFFRLWVGLSVLWVAIAVVILQPSAAANFRDYRVNHRFLAELSPLLSPPVFDADFETRRSRLSARQQILADSLLAQAAPVPGIFIQPPEGRIERLLRARIARSVSQMQSAAMIVLAPPLILLMLGFGAAWIARGFGPRG